METASIGRARKLARKLLKDSGCTTTPTIIQNVVNHLREKSEIDCIPWEISDSLSGWLIEEEGITAIAYNKEHHVHRQRFTVAHEIGHYILSHNNQRKDDIHKTDANPVHEKEANAFATELLMPLELLKKDLKKTCDTEELAKKYWVSKESMGWRIQDPVVLKYI